MRIVAKEAPGAIKIVAREAILVKHSVVMFEIVCLIEKSGF